MLEKMLSQGKERLLRIKERIQNLPNDLSDFTGYAAVRVPLNRASGLGEVTLNLPGYAQVNSFCCGVVAGVMVLKHFRPRASFGQFYERVNPHPENGANTATLARALRRSGLRVMQRSDMDFDRLCAAIDDGNPVIVSIHNRGAANDHWVVVYGYGRNANKVFIATNGFPLFNRNAISLRKFMHVWSPRGNGLTCELRSRRKCVRHRTGRHGPN